MNDYERFLKMARDHAAHIGRIAERLLKEKKIGQGTRDALASAAGDLLHDAYMAGTCEPDHVDDLQTELRRIGGGEDGGALDPCPGCGALPGEACERDCPTSRTSRRC